MTASAYDSDAFPAGWPAPAGEAAAAEWLRLADQALRAADKPASAMVEVQLLRVAKVADTSIYKLIPRGTLVAAPTLPNQTPRRIGKLNLSGGALIDSFLAGGEAWTGVRDERIWPALLQWAETSRPTPNGVRNASDAVAIGVALRHGVPLSAYNLSHGALQPPKQVGG